MVVGRADYHFYFTVRSMIDSGEVTAPDVINKIKQLSKEHPFRFKLRYEWALRNQR